MFQIRYSYKIFDQCSGKSGKDQLTNECVKFFSSLKVLGETLPGLEEVKAKPSTLRESNLHLTNLLSLPPKQNLVYKMEKAYSMMPQYLS